ncbi:MAG TPA: TetR/AcrR family transcriptional regulator [Candidatus Thermoplasmatota archaeon]|nr:TetR/AcrR family transcriptional regulator [Candidatus Thermoplasmatota archaeon]
MPSSRKAPPRTATQTRTRTAILNVAEELVQTHGANGISFATISERVGIRKASIHHHFATKDDLVEELVRRYSGDFLGEVDSILASRRSATAKLQAYMRLFDATLEASPGKRVCLCGMLGAEYASLSPKAASLLKAFYRENEERLALILEAGRRERSLAFAGNARTVGMSLFSFLEGAMLVARADGGPRQFKELTDGVVRLLRP